LQPISSRSFGQDLNPATLKLNDVTKLTRDNQRWHWTSDTLRILTDHGVSIHTTIVHDLSGSLIRPQGDSDWFGRYSLDVAASVGTETVTGANRISGYMRLKQHVSEFGSGYDGVVQGYSNIDGASRTTLYEIWAEPVLFSQRLRLKAGKIDANTEFAVVRIAGDFLNSSMGYSPTIQSLPTYPEPKPGVSVSYGLIRRYRVDAGLFEATKDDKMYLAQVSRAWAGDVAEPSSQATIGYWCLRGNSHDAAEQTSGRRQGLYGVFEQLIWHRPLVAKDDKSQRLLLFLQLGRGNDNNPYAYHAGGGVTMDSPLRRRDSDGAGAAVSWVRLSKDSLVGSGRKSEVVFEAYYKLQVSQHFALMYDMQHYPHTRRPNIAPSYLIATVRSIVTF